MEDMRSEYIPNRNKSDVNQIGGDTTMGAEQRPSGERVEPRRECRAPVAVISGANLG